MNDRFEKYKISDEDQKENFEKYLIPDNKNTEFDPSFAEKFAPNVLAGLAQMGHSIINAPSNIGRFAAEHGVINPETANKIPRQQDYDFSSMLGLPGTTSDKVIQGLTKNLPAMLMPGADLGIIGKGIESIPLAGKSISTALSNIIPQASWGAYTSENPYEGMKEFGLGQAAMEALKTPFSVIKGVSELMRPSQFAKNQMNEIKLGHDVAKTQMEEAYKPVMNQYGDTLTSVTPKSYLGLSKKQIKRFTPEVRRSYDEYLAEPSFRNLHELQSQIGKDYARIAGNTNKINQADSLKISRNYVNSKIASFLNRDEKAKQQYNAGRQIGRDIYYPYLSNNELKKISEGVKKSVKPEELSKVLTKSKEKIIYKKDGMPVTAIPEGHPLSNILDQLDTKIKKGKGWQYTIPMVGASLTGGHFFPGIGHIGGASGGALFAKYLEPKMIDYVQNPEIEKALKKYLQIPGQTAVRGAVGYNMSNK